MASVDEIKANVASSVDGTQRAVHPSVAAAIAQLEQAKMRLDEAATLARSAIDSADTYRMIV